MQCRCYVNCCTVLRIMTRKKICKHSVLKQDLIQIFLIWGWLNLQMQNLPIQRIDCICMRVSWPTSCKWYSVSALATVSTQLHWYKFCGWGFNFSLVSCNSYQINNLFSPSHSQSLLLRWGTWQNLTNKLHMQKWFMSLRGQSIEEPGAILQLSLHLSSDWGGFRLRC
jgi:hypothetical protein